LTILSELQLLLLAGQLGPPELSSS